MDGFKVKDKKDCYIESLREWVLWLISVIFLFDVIIVIMDDSFSIFSKIARCMLFITIIVIMIVMFANTNYTYRAISFPSYLIEEKEALLMYECGEISYDELCKIFKLTDIKRIDFWNNVDNTIPNTYEVGRDFNNSFYDFPDYFSVEFNMYEYYHKNGKTSLFYMMRAIAEDLKNEEIIAVVSGEE